MHHHQGPHSGSSSLSIVGCLACACTSTAPLYTNSPPKPTKVMRVTIVMETTTMMMLMSLMLMLLLMALINFNLTKTLQELRSPTLLSGSAYHPPGGATSSSSLYKLSQAWMPVVTNFLGGSLRLPLQVSQGQSIVKHHHHFRPPPLHQYHDQSTDSVQSTLGGTSKAQQSSPSSIIG